MTTPESAPAKASKLKDVAVTAAVAAVVSALVSPWVKWFMDGRKPSAGPPSPGPQPGPDSGSGTPEPAKPLVPAADPPTQVDFQQARARLLEVPWSTRSFDASVAEAFAPIDPEVFDE